MMAAAGRPSAGAECFGYGDAFELMGTLPKRGSTGDVAVRSVYAGVSYAAINGFHQQNHQSRFRSLSRRQTVVVLGCR